MVRSGRSFPVKDENPQADEMEAAIRRRMDRQKAGETDGSVNVSQHLARIGVLGWTIITPPLFGLLLGRWLDHRVGTGVVFSAVLLLAGFAIGGWSAWKWMGHPNE